MTKNFLTRTLESPLLLLCLIVATILCGFAWQQAHAAATAPMIEGYNWSEHPNALLIVVPPGDCGCGMQPNQIARQAVQRDVDVVVLATHSSDEVKAVEQLRLPRQRLSIFLNAPKEVIQRFSPKEGITAVRVLNGRITHEFTGNLPENFFDTVLGTSSNKEVKL